MNALLMILVMMLFIRIWFFLIFGFFTLLIQKRILSQVDKSLFSLIKNVQILYSYIYQIACLTAIIENLLNLNTHGNIVYLIVSHELRYELVHPHC